MNFLKISLFVLVAFLSGFHNLNGNPGAKQTDRINFPVQEFKVTSEDVTLHVKRVGDARADNVLIATNGGPGQSSRYMDSLSQLVGKNLALVTYDQRGTGLSTESANGYELLKYVEDLEAIRKGIGADTVHILGHSWGGIVTLRYATVYPERVRSIILMGSGPPVGKAAQEGQARLGQRRATLQKQGLVPETLPSNLEDILMAILPAYFSDPGFTIPAEIKESAFNPAVSQQTFAALGNWDFTREVAQLTHPVLFLWGKDDPFGLPMAEATRNSLSKAQVTFVVMERCGHYWQECPELFFSHVRKFLKLDLSP